MKDTRNTLKVSPNPETTISIEPSGLNGMTALCRICGEAGFVGLHPGEPDYCEAHLPEGQRLIRLDEDARQFFTGYRLLSEEGKACIRGILADLMGRSEARKMKDTPATRKTALKPEDAVPNIPGDRLTGWMQELTESEYALVAALRASRVAEASWDAYDEKEAWAFIRSMTQAVIDGDSAEEMESLCDPEQFPHLLAAAKANQEVIRYLKKRWRKGRKREAARRLSLDNPDSRLGR